MIQINYILWKLIFMSISKSNHAHLPVGTARGQFMEIANRVGYGGERVVIERYHKPIMALISVADLELLETLERQYDVELARARLKSIDQAGTLTLAELKKTFNEQY